MRCNKQAVFHYLMVYFRVRMAKSGVLSEPVTSVTLNNPGIYILVIQNNLGNRYEKFVVQ